MVRNYKKVGTRNYKIYTEAQLNEALQKVVNGELIMRAAAVQYKIPFGTLNNRFHGKHIHNAGGQPIFSPQEESALIKAATTCSNWGYPLHLLDLRMLAKAYLDRCGRRVNKFTNNIPGKDWALSLLRRHKSEVAQRLAGNINKNRASVSRETLTKYFTHLERGLEGINACNIFNYDETNVGDDPGKTRCIYRRGVKYPEKIMNHSKSCTTIMVCGSADGTLLPPYVIYKSEHLYNTWKEGGIQDKPCCDQPCCARGCRFNRTNHGWIDASTFQDWFETCFMPHARRLEGRKVLIGDNLASHFNDSVINMCQENDICFVCLVPHSTGICQPLDVAFFKPMKVAWRTILCEYKLSNKSSGIPKEVFPSLLKRALEKMDTVAPKTNTKPGDHQETAIKQNLINVFYAAAIYPFNPNKVIDKILGAPDHNPQPLVNDVLAELLQNNRFGGSTVRTQRKKKRLHIEPGKSVATADDSSSSEDNENLPSPTSNNQSSASEVTLPTEIEEVEYLETYPELLVPDRLVLVNFLGGRRNAINYKYVCKIVSQFTDTEYTVVGFKSTDETKTIFKLVRHDMSTVQVSDICAVLPDPVYNDKATEINFGKKVEVLEFPKGS